LLAALTNRRLWFERSAMADLLGADFRLVEKNALYRCLDKVLEHKDKSASDIGSPRPFPVQESWFTAGQFRLSLDTPRGDNRTKCRSPSTRAADNRRPG
jgi:hypothetical protein